MSAFQKILFMSLLIFLGLVCTAQARTGREAIPHDRLLSQISEIEVKLQELANDGLIKDKRFRNLASKLKIPTGTDGFLLESHPQVGTVDSPTPGIFLAGAVQGPKDIPTTVAQAKAAASSVANPAFCRRRIFISSRRPLDFRHNPSSIRRLIRRFGLS